MEKLAIPENTIQSILNSIQDKNFYITGGTGFFGQSLLDFLNRTNNKYKSNVSLTILSRDPAKHTSDFSNRFPFVKIQFEQGDITDFKAAKKKYFGFFHFATPADATMNIQKPLEMLNLITKGTENTLKNILNLDIEKTLFTSSGAVYGPQDKKVSHVDESCSTAPMTNSFSSAYGEGKRCSELQMHLSARQHGLQIKVARCFAFVGPYLNPNGTFAIGNFIRNAIKNENIIVNGDGTTLRSYLYADDLIVWLFKILIDGKNFENYNVGSDQSISIADLAQKVKTVLNKNIEIEIKQKPNLSTPPDRYVPSIEKVKKDLALLPWTSLESSILQTAEFYQNSLSL